MQNYSSKPGTRLQSIHVALNPPGVSMSKLYSDYRNIQSTPPPEKTGLTSLPDYHQQPVPKLRPQSWSPSIYRILNFWLEYLHGHPETNSMAAVFDFDNTCTYRDVGKAVLQFQFDGLYFQLPPEQFAGLFPDSQVHISGTPLKLIKNRILLLYKKLWPFIKENQQQLVAHQPEHVEFRHLFLWYCVEARRHSELGPRYTLPLMARLLAGYTTDEVKDLTRQALSAALQEPIATDIRRITSCAPIGSIEVQHATGLRVQCEIIDLMEQLKRCGIRCCIISASTEWVVEAAVKHLGFPITPDNIYGIRVQLEGGNRLSTNLPTGYPVTYREGKAKVIRELIDATPVIIAGDAVTDYEMLNLPDVPIRLIINHNKSGLISTLYNDPRFLLQGLNKQTGAFRPHRETLENHNNQQESIGRQPPAKYALAVNEM